VVQGALAGSPPVADKVHVHSDHLPVLADLRWPRPAGGEGAAPVDGWERYREANRANWEDRTPVHLASRACDAKGWLRERRGPRRREAETLGDVTGLRLVHPQCHIGLDALAWARAGAAVTGLDFSPAACVAARDMAPRAGLPAEFVCADVYRAAEVLGPGRFDVVYVSRGGCPASGPGRSRWRPCWPLAGGPSCTTGAPCSTPWRRTAPNSAGRTSRSRSPRSRMSPPHTPAGGRFPTPAATSGTTVSGRSFRALLGRGLRLERLEEHDWTIWPALP